MSELKIFKFGSITDGNSSMKDVLGGKGANLAEMSSLGLPVPPGFTIPCAASVLYESILYASEDVTEAFNSHIEDLVTQGVKYLVGTGGKSPLMSVRSGARVSMPGMMDTILNVGLTSKTLPYWSEKLGAVAALDSYRRLIQMYSSVALGVKLELFEEALSDMRKDAGVLLDSELNADQLGRLVKRYLKIVNAQGCEFPDTPMAQVMGAVAAVFRSWNNPRAIEYRKINNIPNSWGTAVTVQSMVFGNLNNDSCTGVLFSRDPSTGEAVITGEYLVNAQGEDVVAGIRTPESIVTLPEWDLSVSTQLFDIVYKLENHYKDMQDIEFTVEDSKLYILQTRNGKRSAMAAFQVAYDFAAEGLITKEVASSRVNAAQLFSVMQDRIDPSFTGAPSFMGIAAGGGIVKGVAMFTSENAVNCKVPCILVTKETDPDDIAGMNASVGILTATGGLTSHAAVVARGMNKSCVVGATSLGFSTQVQGTTFAAANDGPVFAEGDMLTIDGATGRVWVLIDVPLITGGASAIVKTVIGWGSDNTVADRVEISALMDQPTLSDAIKAVTADSVYLDTVLLEGRERFVTTSSLEARMGWVGEALNSISASEIIVDLSGRESHYSLGDGAFDTMFGLTSKESDLLINAKVKSILSWSNDLRSRIIVNVGPKDSKISGALSDAGFKVSGYVTTFADLLNATGPMSVSDEVISSVFGSKDAYEVAKQAIEKFQGKKSFKPLTVPAYWYEPITKGA